MDKSGFKIVKETHSGASTTYSQFILSFIFISVCFVKTPIGTDSPAATSTLRMILTQVVCSIRVPVLCLPENPYCPTRPYLITSLL